MADLRRRRDSSDRSSGTPPPASKKASKRSRSHTEESSDSGDSRDDSVGHILAGPGDRLGKYEIIKESGLGTFGKVFHCVEVGTGVEVAIKVVRAIPKYTDSAEVEARILTVVNRSDPAGESHCVRFHHTFTHGAHLCMVFELLGPSVYDYLKKNRYKPLPLFCVQALADQLCWAVAYLHELELTHTDLKPENLLLTPTVFEETTARTCTREARTVLAPKCSTMKLIDFGGATFEHQHKSSIINTRQYRAPEVLLDCGWDTASDMWSVGCILMEMYTGELLFATHDNLEHLALIEACLGRVPEHMTRSREAARYYDRGRLSHSRTASRDSIRHVAKMKTLKEIVHKDDVVFLDLVRKCLAIDPRHRLRARDAINHPLFTSVRGFRSPTVPLFRVPAAKQNRLDLESIDALSLPGGSVSVASPSLA